MTHCPRCHRKLWVSRVGGECLVHGEVYIIPQPHEIRAYAERPPPGAPLWSVMDAAELRAWVAEKRAEGRNQTEIQRLLGCSRRMAQKLVREAA